MHEEFCATIRVQASLVCQRAVCFLGKVWWGMKQRHRQSSTKRTQHLATGIAVLGYWWLTQGSRPRSSAFERPRCAITLFFFPRSFSAVGKFSGAGLFYWAASRHRLCLCWPISRCAFGREGVSPDLPLPGLFVAKRLLSFFYFRHLWTLSGASISHTVCAQLYIRYTAVASFRAEMLDIYVGTKAATFKHSSMKSILSYRISCFQSS